MFSGKSKILIHKILKKPNFQKGTFFRKRGLEKVLFLIVRKIQESTCYSYFWPYYRKMGPKQKSPLFRKKVPF